MMVGKDAEIVCMIFTLLGIFDCESKELGQGLNFLHLQHVVLMQ